MMNTTLMSVILLMIALPIHAAEQLWITEDTSTEAVFILAGHADSKGSANYNLGLSLKRATAVQTFLSDKYYLQKTRLILKAYGEIKPIATNLTVEGRTQNRTESP